MALGDIVGKILLATLVLVATGWNSKAMLSEDSYSLSNTSVPGTRYPANLLYALWTALITSISIHTGDSKSTPPAQTVSICFAWSRCDTVHAMPCLNL